MINNITYSYECKVSLWAVQMIQDGWHTLYKFSKILLKGLYIITIDGIYYSMINKDENKDELTGNFLKRKSLF